MLANVALPAFLPHSLATLLGILVIAAIEGLFISRHLTLAYRESYSLAIDANIKSTVVGIPVAWLLWLTGLVPVSQGIALLGLEVNPALASTATQTVLAGGFMPDEWTDVGFAAAWLLMLVPYWMGSVWIERRIILKRRPDCDSRRLSKAVMAGNLASYSLFLVVGVVALFKALEKLPEERTFWEKRRVELEENRARIRAEESETDKSSRG